LKLLKEMDAPTVLESVPTAAPRVTAAPEEPVRFTVAVPVASTFSR
jgi:hypothetical protein